MQSNSEWRGAARSAVGGAPSKCALLAGCCERHPKVCAPHSGAPSGHPLRSAGSSSSLLPSRAAQGGTYECCGMGQPPPKSATFWRAPVTSTAPYEALVARILEPFTATRIPWHVVRASAYDRSTCAVLRVAGGRVCKVPRTNQRTADYRRVQEAGLFALVRELAAGGAIPDLELAYCMVRVVRGSSSLPPSLPLALRRLWRCPLAHRLSPTPLSYHPTPPRTVSSQGDGSKVVADEHAARRRWGGTSSCAAGTVFRSASFQQFRCQVCI